MMQTLDGVAVLILASGEGVGHIRRGFHVFGDDVAGEVHLQGAGLDGGFQDVLDVEFFLEEGHHGGEAIIGVVRVGAYLLHRFAVVLVELVELGYRLAAA